MAAKKKKKAKRKTAVPKTRRAPAIAIAVAPAFPLRLQSGPHNFQLDPARARLILDRKLGARALAQLLAELRLELDDGRDDAREPKAPVLASERAHWVRAADRGVLVLQRVRAILRAARVAALWPVYRRTDIPGARGLMAARLGTVIVRNDLADRFAKDLAGAGLQAERRFRVPGLRLFSSGNLNDARVFEVGAKLAADYGLGVRLAARLAVKPIAAPAVSYDWVPLISPFAAPAVDPTDTLFDTGGGDAELAGHQWYMKRIGARYAWAAVGGAQPGNAAVTVFLFDRGIDLQHADFSSVQQLELFNGLADPAATQPADGHGTLLAGIVAARHNDGNPLAGLAPGCPFRSLRFDDGIDPFAVSTAAIAAAVSHAGTIDNSVLLIGMDAGAGVLTDATVQTAINGNTRSLVVVPTGNDTGLGSSIGYGTVQPQVLICAGYAQTDATNRNGRWLAEAFPPDVGSKVGPEVSVAAPAAAIITTNWVSGMTNRYTAAPGARGTSLAAAQAAGMAALAWSRNTALTPAAVRTQLEQTAAKCGVDRPSTTTVEQTAYRTVPGHPNGGWNDHLGYGSIDASAALVGSAVETDTASTDPMVARVIIRDNPADAGAEPSTGSLVSQCDIVVSTNPALITTGVFTVGAGGDAEFDTALGTPVDQVGSASTYHVFVRVHNIGPEDARGVRVTASLAACATSFMYPNSWDDPTGTITVNALNDTPPADLSYFAGPLAMSQVFIARLTVPSGSDFSGFSGHACCVARVVAANDVNFTRATVSGSSAQRLYNNLAQRNLSVV